MVIYARTCFNPRPHAGGDHELNPDLGAIGRCFNPRPHAGGDAAVRGRLNRTEMFQSTPPRGGRLRTANALRRLWTVVSIHAPTRGATLALIELRRRCRVVFQSTPPRGGRRRAERYRSGRLHVSIHAPTRGATGNHQADRHCVSVSIHAPTRGATMPVPLSNVAIRTISIHAPTRGATALVLSHCHPVHISIHAPTRGATPCSSHPVHLII